MITALRRRLSLDAWLSRWGILDWLRLLWLSAVFWYELGSFLWHLAPCTWPDNALTPARERPSHVLLIADPQVRELSTFRARGFPAFHHRLVDHTLRRNWFFALRKKPDTVVFLGDMLASWRVIRSDEQYEQNYDKFIDIFHRDSRVQSYFIPGNNDVGLNIDPPAARQAHYRYTTHFGALNQRITIRNHTLVMLDAAGLVEEDYLRSEKYIDYDRWTPMPRGPVEFVHSLREENATNPSILLTHIPLYRPDAASCGPLREKGTIRRGVGPSYQNTLGKKTTTFLLQMIKPQIVFSADDKDYCDYVHIPPQNVITDGSAPSQEDSTVAAKAQKVREVTLKAFSPSPEIHYPGFQLLSLATPTAGSSSQSSLATKACFFPDYPSVYSWRYPPLLLLTILTLILLRRRKLRNLSLPTHLKASALRKSFSLNSLPTAPWSPHPPTPFSSDWTPQTPGFFNSRYTPKKSLSSPVEDFPRDSLRAPLLSASSSSSAAIAGDAETLTTPAFRASVITVPRTDGSERHLPTGPAHIDADELDDEFAYARYDLRASPPERDADDELYDDGTRPADRLAIVFTLNGRRRRVAPWSWLMWIPLLFGLGRTSKRPGLESRRRSMRAFMRRVGMDLVYIFWPALVLWAVLAWLVS